jgi:hypothetical protein
VDSRKGILHLHKLINPLLWEEIMATKDINDAVKEIRDQVG